MSNNSKEAAEFVFAKMEQYFDAATEVLQQYGPDAAELGLAVLRIEALAELFPGIGALLVFIVALKYANPLTQIRILNECPTSEEPRHVILLFGGAIVLIGSVPVVLGTLFNVWAWVGLFYPELYAVHKLILT